VAPVSRPGGWGREGVGGGVERGWVAVVFGIQVGVAIVHVAAGDGFATGWRRNQAEI
jgi:hypothetical protein